MAGLAAECYLAAMNLPVLMLVLLLLLGLNCFYFAGFAIGGEVIGVILFMALVICLVDRLLARA
jgi:hypothetical protein